MNNSSIFLNPKIMSYGSFLVKRGVSRPVDDPAALILEAWSQGLMTGSLVVMAAINYVNMRSGVFLHKMILLEVRWLFRAEIQQQLILLLSVDLGHASWNLHLRCRTSIRVVFGSNGDWADHLLVLA
jgi:hypothetical protein